MEPIPMGSLDMESRLFDGTSLSTQGSKMDLFISLNALQQANLIQYRHVSNKIVVFGIDRHVYQKESSRGREDIKSALSTVLSHLTTTDSTFEQDQKKRLIDIYTEMPSPQPTTDIIDSLSNKVDKATQRLLDSVIELDAPDGMRTKLYEYQKKSIWKMLKRELCPGYILDPCLIPMKDMENNEYFIDYSDTGLGIYRTPTRRWDDVRGGILCEDMFSVAPSPFTQLYSELAPYVPSMDVDGVSDLFPRMVLPPLTPIPTLKDLAAASIKIHGIEFRRFEEHISASAFELLEEFPVFYHHTNDIQIRNSRVKSINPIEIYLSNATLVIVPANLVDQWCNEINKHTRDFALKLLVLTSNDKSIPEPKILASRDMVLISQSRFAKEYEKGVYASPKDVSCNCHENYIRCLCRCSRTISPLRQLRWKRIIVDEGHTMSADLSNHALLASKLHADRRWICTGTPTSNLANLVPSVQSTSAWTDQSDLTRLSSLICSFFQIHPYVDNKSLFSKEIRKPFIDHNKASRSLGVSLATLSSVKRLRHLLERLMTRNRPDEINRFVTLPPLFERVVRLDLEYFQTLSLNSQIALIQANAVLTQREDQDYFFHPSNLKHLRQVIDNLNNGCFWYSGGENYATLIRGTIQLAERGVEAPMKYPPDDIALLKEVIKHLQLALSDSSWNTLVTAQEVGFFCRVPEALQHEALIPSSSLGNILGDNVDVCVLLANQINSLKETRHQLRDPCPIETTTSKACILSSTSSKLNYIVSQILYHHAKEKCVVFCQSSNSIYYIREYLTLAKIRCLTYHSGMTQSERSSCIMTFNTSENVAAIIMDTKHAAFGIDLSSASRVYFVSPVWQTATMRQAVKRAHRIGQTRPVYVETLVIRDSFEEAILNRRSELDEPLEPPMELSGDFGEGSRNGRRHAHVMSKTTVKKGKSMADDGKFRELISHIGFMPLPSKRNTISVLNDYIPIDVEDGAIKDLKIPIAIHGLGEMDHLETEYHDESHVQDLSTLSIRFEEDVSEIAQDEILAFDDSSDESKIVKEEPKDEPMEVHEWYEITDNDKKVKAECETEEPKDEPMEIHEWYEITDDDKKVKVEDETEEPFKSEYGPIKELGVMEDQEIEPTRMIETSLSQRPLEVVKRETSYEKEDNFKRVRFG
ncbi:hypothetical protein BGZ81_004041 [Podila clonocystis]|nr:hypothetical protein BGZ81_004041 [Podila clonocystis]